MRAKKSLGQHFLEPAWADKLVDAIEPSSTDRFIEIGPGPGALTLRLAPRVSHVTAIEIDREMVERLRPRVPGNVELLHADFLAVDTLRVAGDGEEPVRVAGNLPYNVSSPILFRLLQLSRETRVRDASIMLQLEVAERIEADPGGREYGVLAVLVQRRADVRRLLTLPPGAFRPPPAVRSAVLRLTFRPPAHPVPDEAVLEGMVRSMFTRRRKTLANALGPFARARGLEPLDALRAAGIDPVRRPETLDGREVAALATTCARSAETRERLRPR